MAQSAAAEVFAMPELLEHILLYHAAEHDDDCMDHQVLALYRWQRINKTTMRIIMGSIKLRRYMMLEPWAEETDKAREVHAIPARPDLISPLYWCLRKINELNPRVANTKMKSIVSTSVLDSSGSPSGIQRLIFKMGTVSVYEDCGTRSCPKFDQAMVYTKASYRALRLLRVDDSNYDVRITQTFSFYKMGEYEEEFKVDSTTTLGEFYNWWEVTRWHNFNQHRAILKNTIATGKVSMEGSDYVWETDYPRRRAWLYG